MEVTSGTTIYRGSFLCLSLKNCLLEIGMWCMMLSSWSIALSVDDKTWYAEFV